MAASTLLSLVAASTLVTGVSFALFSASSPSQSGTFTSGSVVVGLGSGTSVQCNVSNQAPGDASTGYPSGSGVANQLSTQCTYFVTYTGSVSAWLAVDVAVADGTPSLYDGTAAGLQLLVKDGSTTFIGSGVGAGGTSYTAQGGSTFGATLASPGTASDLLVSTSPQAGTFTDEFTIDYHLPIPSSNANIGGSSTVTLTFHAVQAGNNALPASCTAAGMSCATGMSWS